MKKTILLLASFLSFASCFSQSYFSVGAGTNINLGESSQSYSSSTTFGSLVEFNFNREYGKFLFRPGIQAELIYWNHQRIGLISIPEAPIKSRLLYISILPQIEWKPINSFSIGGGGFYKFLIQEQARDPYSSSLQSSNANLYENSDFGLHLTANTYFKNFSFGINYLHGMKTILPISITSNGNLLAVLKAKNRIFQARLLYFFSSEKS